MLNACCIHYLAASICLLSGGEMWTSLTTQTLEDTCSAWAQVGDKARSIGSAPALSHLLTDHHRALWPAGLRCVTHFTDSGLTAEYSLSVAAAQTPFRQSAISDSHSPFSSLLLVWTSAVCSDLVCLNPQTAQYKQQGHACKVVSDRVFGQQSINVALHPHSCKESAVCPLKVTPYLPSGQWGWVTVIAETDRKRHIELELHLIFNTQWTCGESMSSITPLLYRPVSIGRLNSWTSTDLACPKNTSYIFFKVAYSKHRLSVEETGPRPC